MATLMSDLNPQQEQAVQHVEGPLLVLAGAGSGKTRVVTYRIARLIDIGILPSDILAVTFTNKAAEEMKTRIRTLKNAQVLACTFHSLGARILRESIGGLGYRPDFAIYDEEDSEKLLKSCMEQLNLSSEKGILRQLRHQISAAKNDLIGPDETANDRLLHEVYGCYQKKLKECNALDFDDLLYLTVKLLREDEKARKEYQNRWLFVLIDEYQDTNLAQYHLAKMLVEQHRNLFAVGDPDQSIYSWRGARYQNILNFESDFPGAKVITLDQNYRSTNNILNAANAVIEHNGERYEKKLWSQLGPGEKIGMFIGQNERQEAEFVAERICKHTQTDGIIYDDIAIFFRTNAQSRIFEDLLLSRKIPYTIVGGLSFYDRREVKDLLAYLRMAVSNTDLISFLRTVNLPRRGLGASALEKITAAASERNLPIFTFCEELLSYPALCLGLKLGPKQKEGLQDYVRTIHHLRNRRGLKIHELIAEALSESRYLSYIREDPETFQDRKENLDELLGKAAEWEEEQEEPTLVKFLEELSLRSQIQADSHLPSVKLMTLHNSKGLEFSLVCLVGLEEDLFPHINSKDDPKAIEEERRLFYVGMTRAKRRLYLCSAVYRFMWGTARPMRPSRFLKEVPSQFLQNFSLSSDSLHFGAEEFEPGDRVYHKEFGEGIVQRKGETSLGLTYEVYFPEAETTRTLAAKYAKLRNASFG